MKKPILILAVLILAGLACSSVQIADPAIQQPNGGSPADTPDAVATVLAEVANATKNAPPPTDAPPTETPDQTSEAAGDAGADGAEDVGPTATPTKKPASGSTGYPTAISLPDPKASKFHTCLTDCLTDGSNSQPTFPEKTDTIHFSFDFEDFPIKAPYTRTWTKDGVLWAKYTCLWPGPEFGTDNIALTDPNGLASGIWNVLITVNGKEVLNETILVDGSYSFWSPPGYFNGCYGTK